MAQIQSSRSQELAQRLRAVDSAGISATRKGGQPVFWQSARNAQVQDVDGNSFLDCTSSFGVLGVGYCHPRLAQAVQRQLEALTHTMGGINPHEPYIKALESIKGAVGRSGDAQVILGLSGSEAVEAALKLAWAYTRKPGVVAFHGAYHGQSLGALSVTSHNCFRDPFYPIVAQNVTFTPYPDPYRDKEGADGLVWRTMSRLEAIVAGGKSGGLPVGAVILEPMQNASGYIVPPKGFLKQLREFCTTYGLLLIADEIFTGFGRCGRWLAFDYEAVSADITCVGKVMGGGFSASACVASQKIMSALDHEGMVGLHGGTFDGNPVSCTAIVETIAILREENLIERSYRNGERLRKALGESVGLLECSGEVRGLGSATVVEFVADKTSKVRDSAQAQQFQAYLAGKGINTLLTGLPYGNSVALCPPFTIPEEQMAYLIETCAAYRPR